MSKIFRFMKRHKIITFFLLLVIIFGMLRLRSVLHDKKAAKADLLGVPVEKYEKYVKSLKDTPSDITGMSQYDKYKMGLNFQDGADSDYDGLTDKEEIEVYGTDPLKSSTSGDLYSDGYKVKNNMDLTKKYDYDQDIVFSGNECVEVELTADEPTDLSAVVEDCSTRYSLEPYGIKKIYKGYWMYNYNGTVKIDLSDVLDKTSEISVWVCKGDFLVAGVSDLEKCKYKLDGNVATLKYDFEMSQSYYIYVTEKVSGITNFLSGINRTSSLQATGSSAEDGIAFVCGFPIIEQFFNVGGHIDYSELENETSNNSFLIRAINYCNKSVLGSKISTEDTQKLNATDASSIKKKAEFFKKYLPIFEMQPVGEETFFNYIFQYTVYNDNGTNTAANEDGDNGDTEQRRYYRNYHTEFDQYTDELPFQNFESEYAEGGNCAGISHLTAYLFNTGSLPASGSYDGISWNLLGEAENDTLMDRGLEDYKTRSFVDEHSGKNNNYIGDGLTSGEQEFVKMIGAFWKEANDKVNLNDYALSNDNSEKWDWSVAEQMTSYLDQGKIVCASMLFRNGTGHEINLYDYYYLDNGELLFRVYDSNIPQNMRKGYTLNCDGACYLQCKKLTRPDGSEAFSYLYFPIEGNIDYLASSSKSFQSVGCFVATDENWNVLQ